MSDQISAALGEEIRSVLDEVERASDYLTSDSPESHMGGDVEQGFLLDMAPRLAKALEVAVEALERELGSWRHAEVLEQDLSRIAAALSDGSHMFDEDGWPVCPVCGHMMGLVLGSAEHLYECCGLYCEEDRM